MGDESSSVYIAVEDYESRDPNASMSFAKGERVTVLEKKESGWWFVRIDDCEGWVPGAFFEPVVSDEIRAQKNVSFLLRLLVCSTWPAIRTSHSETFHCA